MEPTGFAYPLHNPYPQFFLLCEDRRIHQKQTGCYDEIIRSGHQVSYYIGSTHISFMDHGYINPPNPITPNEPYFNGSLEERKTFFNAVRTDIRTFLQEQLG
jgi:hypothetical protein